MSVVFVWEDQYSVGIPELDEQHRYLFQLGNEISGIRDGQSGSFVMKLYEYARINFKTEEHHMEAVGFPELEAHKKAHESFVTDLNRITHGFPHGSKEELKIFLYAWLVNHILWEDNKYFIYANNLKRFNDLSR